MLPPGLAAIGRNAGRSRLAARGAAGGTDRGSPHVGACACDLVRPEIPIRGRTNGTCGSGTSGWTRSRHHRRRAGAAPAAAPTAAAGGWRPALAGFVAEHARNAGPTVYELRFGRAADAASRTAAAGGAEIHSAPDGRAPGGRAAAGRALMLDGGLPLPYTPPLPTRRPLPTPVRDPHATRAFVRYAPGPAGWTAGCAAPRTTRQWLSPGGRRRPITVAR